MAEYCEYDWGMRRFDSSVSTPCKTNQNIDCDKRQALEALRELIPSRPDVEFLRTDDDFLMRFLHARKCNVQDSFELLVNYYSYRQRNSQLFVQFSAQEEGIQQALRDGFPGVLPDRDRKGRCVLVIFTANWDHCAYSLVTIYRALLLSLEHLVEKPRNQVNGFVVVVDWSEFSFRQSSNLNPRILRLMIEGLQDCFPARFKGIHFTNQPWYVEGALTLIRPFLKEKTKEKIYLHGNNLSTLHDYVTKDILPAELGGEAPAYNPMVWANKLLETSTRNSGVIFKSDSFSSKSTSKVDEEVVKNTSVKNGLVKVQEC
ncbi:clavesin-2 isoform X2 [Anabrus simplex]